MKLEISCVVLLATLTVGAQNREAFLTQQAYAEMQRVSGQIDVMQSNFNNLQQRVNRLEGSGETRGIRQEIEALKAAIAELRREMQNQRGEIVRDLSGRLSKIQQQTAPAPAPKPKVVVGPHFEYTVQSGDTLSIVAKAFDTTVKKIKEINSLKSDTLRVGQKINVPAPKK